MEKTRAELKDKFQDGDIPTGTDFADLIDSFLDFKDDGLFSFKGSAPGPLFKRFGINDEAPECPLGIAGEVGGDDGMICFTSNDGTTKWNINLNPSPIDIPGFSIDDLSNGTGISRFFIQPSTGFVGIGTFTPEYKLHIEDAVENGYVSEKIRNISTFNDHPGFLLSHFSGDSTMDPRDGAFGIVEDLVGGKVERITVLPEFTSGGFNVMNVGVNENLPFATLHVSRPADDPNIRVNLAENTGILLLGPIEDKNLGFDNYNIQARTGSIVESTGVLSFVTSELGLQPRGGDIIIHSDYNLDLQVKITDAGSLGIGKDPIESIDSKGAITIGDSISPGKSPNGTIRFTGTDFEGKKDTKWVSLTQSSFTDGIWSQPGGPNTGLIYFKPSDPVSIIAPRVGIGLDTPTNTFQVYENENVTETNNSAVLITNESSVTGTAFANTRVGLEVQNNLQWSTNGDARNVGIYVSNVSGQTSHEANLAAVFNGNTVVGTLTGENVVGTNGTNVLAIQNGSVPAAAPGTTLTGGIQIYSDNITLVAGGNPFSVAHLMNGDGSVMKFFQQGPITSIDINTPNTGNPVTDAIIANTRQRVLDIENVLKNLGLLL